MKEKLRVGVTGSTGFAGKRFMAYNAGNFELRAIPLRNISVSELDLRGLDAIVHFAGKAHQMEPIADAEYFEVNTELTQQLARHAAAQGVKQFVYISSTKAFGEELDQILDESSVCDPKDAYGLSKLKAEELLNQMQSEDFHVAVVRPPLVYGPEVKGNMVRLLKLAATGYPLPFGKTGNVRSMVFIDNLVELINAILLKNASGLFLAGDQHSVSTDLLIKLIRKEMGIPFRLVTIPKLARNLLREYRPALYSRLFGSFELNSNRTNRKLNFVPPYTVQEGIHAMVEWYRHAKK